MTLIEIEEKATALTSKIKDRVQRRRAYDALVSTLRACQAVADAPDETAEDDYAEDGWG